jgi:hypothetical protein
MCCGEGCYSRERSHLFGSLSLVDFLFFVSLPFLYTTINVEICILCADDDDSTNLARCELHDAGGKCPVSFSSRV